MPDATSQSFSPAELAALRYVQSHSREVAGMSARELAARAGCSAATVVRLSRRLGYEGYADYRFALSHRKDAIAALEEGVRRDLLIETKTSARLNRPEDIERVADLFATRENIVLVGGGLTHTAMEYLHRYLLSASCPTVCMPNIELSRDVVRSSGPDALIICASISGMGSTLELARDAHGRGMFVVGITSSLTSGMVAVSDICLMAACAPRSDSRLSSRLGIVAIVDLLARTYARRHLHGSMIERKAAL